EGVISGQVVKLEAYQSAYGILRVAIRQYSDLDTALRPGHASSLDAAGAALGKLQLAIPAVQPLAALTTADAVQQQADTVVAALNEAAGVPAGGAPGNAVLAATRRNIKDA